MSAARPDPDELLARVCDEERAASRGKLTIFFGLAPGVGKTYAMLEAARAEVYDAKRDVVMGIVETHGRYDTAALLMGLEIVARRQLTHRGIALDELDLDAILARRPQLVLVDELAHTNAPGSRHVKRWQDVDELLAAGIDVFTTLNVQHLESLNDVVAQITGVVVGETVPDAVFDTAYEVRVVDLPVDELLDRLREGRVYLPAQAERAREGFFREGNLTALRELALRRTAERVDAKMRGYKAAHGIEPAWQAGERVLVCISPSPHSAHLVRAARRLATSLHAELVGVYVETATSLRLTAAARDQLAENLRLVEALGGEAVTVRGDDAAEVTLRYARKRDVTKVVVGKPTHARWRDVLGRSFLDEVVRQSREIDVYVISGRPGDSEARRRPLETTAPRLGWDGVAMATFAAGTSTLVSWYGFGLGLLPDVVMVYLLGVVLVAMRFGYAPSLLAAVLSVAAFDFFFVPPYFSFAVSDLRHTATFVVMFVVAVVISHLTQRIRDQADDARGRERRTATLYAMSRELGLAPGPQRLLEVADRHLQSTFGARVALLAPRPGGELAPLFAEPGTLDADDKDLGAAEWVWLHQRPAGHGTDTLPSARALFLPLKGSRGRVAVLAIYPSAKTRLGDPNERQLLDALAGLVGLALERTQLADEARRARLQAETEQLRSSLLSSVSHDLRTPLAVVTGATSSLLDPLGPQDPAVRRDLLETAHDEAMRLSHLLRNLLDMTRLEAGAMRVKKEAQPLEEVVGAALGRMEDRLAGRAVNLALPPDLPLVPIDAALVEQVLINLLENATRYTPDGTAIDVSARSRERDVVLEVADRGPGIDPRDVERVFEKFYRAGNPAANGGTGLGLTICRGIVEAHGGRIWVAPRDGGGAAFCCAFPLDAGHASAAAPGGLAEDAIPPAIAMSTAASAR